jgi:hypothetical protein
MPPKFQSTFIPTGPAVSSAPSYSQPRARRGNRDLFSFLSGTFFTLSVLFSLGAFGYKYFLSYRIEQMGAELESARAALQPEAVTELIRLNSRIVSTKALIENHRIITPVFEFIEAATPLNVRYTSFNFNLTPSGLDLDLRGEAQSYAALAAAAEIYSRANSNFRNPTFSNLELDASGNVLFSLQMEVEPALLSYARMVEGTSPIEAIVPATSTTTPATGTSTGAVVPGPQTPR